MKLFKAHVYQRIANAAGTITSRQRLRQITSIPLYRNALYLMSNTAVTSLLGFFFWMVVAILFLLLGIFGITQSLTFRYWESMVLPLATSSLIFILAAVEVGKEFRRQDNSEAAIEKKTGEGSKNKVEIGRLC